MRKKSIVTFCFVVVVAILLNLVAFCGLPGSLKSKFGGMFDDKTGIRQGIDLRGGSVITFAAPEGSNPTNDEMETVKSIYETRLNAAGYTETRIAIGEGGQITIEIPTGTAPSKTEAEVVTAAPAATEEADADDETASDAPKATETASEAPASTEKASQEPEATEEASQEPESTEQAAAVGEETTTAAPVVNVGATSETDEAVALLSQVAKLTFRDASGNVVLEGTDVASAKSIYGKPNQTSNSQYYVQVSFTTEGSKKFSEATAKAVGSTISIYMDETEVSRPTVNERIDSDSCVITGQFDAQTAARLANQINSGNLPFEMTKISQSTVGAELGDDALPTSQKAAIIGIILVMIFMLWRYKLPGLIADLSLLIYIGLICLVMGVFRINLSLSGIAGIVLSIGMAVDADCIIFERIKEELSLGKSIRASVEAGFSKAFSAILDSNVTTIITCVILYLSGIGTVTGFAITLGIGVILSMFTAIIITKFLLRTLVNIGVKNRNLFYNAKKQSGGAENE